MEVISRRERQSIIIGEQTHITVLKIYEDHVRLAISSLQHQPSFWEADVYLTKPEKHASNQPWWLASFRGINRFQSHRRDT